MIRFTALLLSIAVVASCAKAGDVLSPTGLAGTGSVVLAISFDKLPKAPGLAKAPASDFVSGTVTLTQGATVRTEALVITGARASASFANLAAGVWQVTVTFFNADGQTTFTGTSSVTVKNGKVTTVPVVVQPTGGTISIDFDLPIDPMGIPAVPTNLTSVNTAPHFADIQWDAVAGAEFYEVQYLNFWAPPSGNGPEWYTFYTGPLSHLENRESWENIIPFRVRAGNSDGVSEWSAPYDIYFGAW
jgi:hypothetical protein